MSITFKDNNGGKVTVEDQNNVFSEVHKVTTKNKVDSDDKVWYKQIVEASQKGEDLTVKYINGEIASVKAQVNTICTKKDEDVTIADLKECFRRFAVLLNDVELYLNFSRSDNMYFKKDGDEDGK